MNIDDGTIIYYTGVIITSLMDQALTSKIKLCQYPQLGRANDKL